MEIGEILIFNSALSDEQVFMVQGYLSHKWGMQDEMPESHPYAETGPIFENRPEINIADPYTLLLDQNVSFVLETNRPATNFSASVLPSGLFLDFSTVKLVDIHLHLVLTSQIWRLQITRVR